MRYKIDLAYDGSSFRGWQRQLQTTNTVQEKLEGTFKKLFKTDITCMGCGRTDKGVHASHFVMHVDIESPFEFDLKERLNRMLPNSIAIQSASITSDEFHARFDAKMREYQYFFHFFKDPFLDNKSYYYDQSALDMNLISDAIEIVKKQKDFYNFCKSPNQYQSTICDLQIIELNKIDKEQFIITLQANRFLQGMVRLIVARLFDVGRKALTLTEFQKAAERKIEFEFKSSAHPQGLFLTKVEY